MKLSFLALSPHDRRVYIEQAAIHRDVSPIMLEKDFWVCWTLDALFNGDNAGDPRLLFKGGTSLSKAYGLISRFSEDIDITIFRDDLGEDASVKDLEALSNNQRRNRENGNVKSSAK